jgi:hypothetical protein
LSDATARDNYAPAGLTIDRSGRWIVPLNVAVNVDSTNNVTVLENAADILAHVRGGIIGVSFDSNLPLIRLVEVVNKLEQYWLPFLDLAELPNRVQLRDTLLLTGRASVSLGLQDSTIRWKTFDRRGQLLAEDEQKTRFTGQREFKRIGIGTFELVQFRQGGAR